MLLGVAFFSFIMGNFVTISDKQSRKMSVYQMKHTIMITQASVLAIYSFVNQRHKTANSKEFVCSPGVTAVQPALQPSLVLLASVWKNISMTLLVLLMLAGREEPQAFPNKVVPSPSVILTKSHGQVVMLPQSRTSKWVNSSSNIFPIFTSIVCVFSKLFE